MVPFFLAGVITVVVLSFIVFVVLTNNRYVASFIQMGDLQRRSEVNDEIQKSKAVRKLSVEKLVRYAPVERLSFTLGVQNALLTSYILGRWPHYYWIWYVPKAIGLTTLRWLEFRQKKTHYLLFDFCYWANGITLVYILFFPANTTLFSIVFLSANGPLAWSILAFNQALVFHKVAQTTSVFIHVAPMCLTYGLRWFPSAFTVCPNNDCTTVSSFEMLWKTQTYFYLVWIVVYYIFVFVMLGDYLKSRSFTTLYDRVAGNQMRWLFQHKALQPAHELFKKAIYMCTHLIFGLLTMVFASFVLFHYHVAHMAFIVVMISMSAYNASLHYEAQFKSDAEFAQQSKTK